MILFSQVLNPVYLSDRYPTDLNAGSYRTLMRKDRVWAGQMQTFESLQKGSRKTPPIMRHFLTLVVGKNFILSMTRDVFKRLWTLLDTNYLIGS